MIVAAVVLVTWVLLTVPAAVLMGKCIARGLAPAPAGTVRVPEQRSAAAEPAAPAPAQAVRSQA